MMKRFWLIGLVLIFTLTGVKGQDIYKEKKFRSKGNTRMLAVLPYGENYVMTTPNTATGMVVFREKKGRKRMTVFEYNPKTRSFELFAPIFAQADRHHGIPSFTSDLQTMVFCQEDRIRKYEDLAIDPQMPPMNLYFSSLNYNSWSRPEAFEHNDDLACLFSPSLSPGGDTLFFAANFEGGFGGFDLYWCIKRNGSWSEPENLGPGVNTEGDEFYPSVHPRGQLYFSSNGHDGLSGGFDLFESRFIDREWKQAVKLPSGKNQPNSDGNDYFIWYSEDMRSAIYTTDYRSRTAGARTLTTTLPELLPESEWKPIKKTYYKYRIYDKKLDSINTELFRYSWSINDTLEIPGHDIIYQFPEPGVYVCKLNVYDIQLDTLVEGQTVKTLPIRLNVQAVIDSPDTVRVGEEVRFDGRQTHLPDVPESARAYYWNFGDNNFGTGSRARHTYEFPGTYRVVLNVDEQQGRGSSGSPKRYANYRDILVLEE